MRWLIAASAATVALLAPSAAHACTALPAPSAKYVPISVVKVDEDTKRTALRVCVDGRRVELARGAMRERRRDRARSHQQAHADSNGHRPAKLPP